MFFSVNQSKGTPFPTAARAAQGGEHAVSGQCFSSTYEAYRSHPIVPVCILLGQAAGTAAAMAVANRVSRPAR